MTSTRKTNHIPNHFLQTPPPSLASGHSNTTFAEARLNSRDRHSFVSCVANRRRPTLVSSRVNLNLVLSSSNECGGCSCVFYREFPSAELAKSTDRICKRPIDRTKIQTLRTEMSAASTASESISATSPLWRSQTKPKPILRSSRASMRGPLAAGLLPMTKTRHPPMCSASYSPRS